MSVCSSVCLLQTCFYTEVTKNSFRLKLEEEQNLSNPFCDIVKKRGRTDESRCITLVKHYRICQINSNSNKKPVLKVI